MYKKIIKKIKKQCKGIQKKIGEYIKTPFIFLKNIFKTHRKKKILFLVLSLLYIVSFFYRYEIEWYLTFPGVVVNTLEYTKSDLKKMNIDFEEVNIPLAKKWNINGLFINNNSKKTVYYFHGNGGDLTYFYSDIQFISSLGYNVMAYDYPWYGKSTGFPYEKDVRTYSEIFSDYIFKEKWISEKDVITWTYSVGTGVWIEWAKNKDINSLVLFSPFLSRFDLSRDHYLFAIQKIFFLPNSFISKENIKNISAPTLFIHGNKDKIISFYQGKDLFLNSKKNTSFFLEVDGANHHNLLSKGIIREYIKNFLITGKLKNTYSFISKKDAYVWERENNISLFDLETDTSFTKFVNPDVSFQKKSYIPEDLESLDRTYIIDAKGNAQLRKKAKQAFQRMAEAFYKENGEKIVVVSSYRSYAYQVGIKARGCPDNLCSKAGYSEHQSWLAVDLWSASTNEIWKSNQRFIKYYDWLSKNADVYGFHNTYQKWRKIDGYEIEPWHWRYLGIPLATYLKNHDITFAEFYKEKNK